VPRASLISDDSARRRAARSGLASLLVHAALLGIAVLLSATGAARQAERRVRLTFFDAPEATPAPPAAEPAPAPVPAAPPPPRRRVFVRKVAPPPQPAPRPAASAMTQPLVAPTTCTDPNGCNQNPGAAGGREGGTGTAAGGTGTGTGTGVAPPRPMYLSPGMTRPRLLSGEQPRYTEQARRARVEGEVIVRIEVAADGRVREAKILRGLALLDQEVLRKVRGWRFSVPTYRGQPVSVYLIQRIAFRLED
jgi:protein TonB